MEEEEEEEVNLSTGGGGGFASRFREGLSGFLEVFPGYTDRGHAIARVFFLF